MPEFPNKTFYDEIFEFAIEQTSYELLDVGIDANIINPIASKLQSSVDTGANVFDLIEELDVFITGGDKGVGALKNYTTQVANDALTQFNANYVQAIALDLGFEFYKYTGTKIATTRDFCRDFSNKYYHKKEVEQFGIAKNPLTGFNLSSNQLKGRKKGTNKSNIFRRRGGWQCRHFFTPLSTRRVPKKDLKRALKNGYWNPTEREIDRFLK
jgi:hypothetical protein